MTMKRILYAIAMLGVLFATSCKKDEIGDTATVDMAGEWYVKVDLLDTDGNVMVEDAFGGSFLISTFNTAENVPGKMFVYDNGNFWDFQVELVADPASKTFKTDGFKDNLAYDGCQVNVKDGKIVYGGTETPSGVKADYIELTVEFSDDEPVGVYMYRLYGFRYTGLASDD